MKCVHVLVLFLTMMTFSINLFAAGDGPSKDVPELQHLSNYVGSWDVVITSKNARYIRGQATTKWILGSRYVQQTGSLAASDGSKDMKVTTLMTYDPRKRAYRMWTFMSDGFASEAEGQWDSNARTMTSISHNEGYTTKTTAHFPEDGIEKWEMVVTDQAGKAITRTSGTNTRRKE
jgi:hypothetical protein